MPYTFLFYKKPGSRPNCKGFLVFVQTLSSKSFLKVLHDSKKNFSASKSRTENIVFCIPHEVEDIKDTVVETF